jgi:hypothetical protein
MAKVGNLCESRRIVKFGKVLLKAKCYLGVEPKVEEDSLEETTHKGIRKRVIYYFPFLTKPGQT